MLPQPRLRFLLADDAGAGKTIMSGLYIREMLARRRIRRILIVPPAGLVGNWERELRTLLGLEFTIVSGTEARLRNPFAGVASDRLILSVDTLAGTGKTLHAQLVEAPDVCGSGLPGNLLGSGRSRESCVDFDGVSAGFRPQRSLDNAPSQLVPVTVAGGPLPGGCEQLCKLGRFLYKHRPNSYYCITARPPEQRDFGTRAEYRNDCSRDDLP